MQCLTPYLVIVQTDKGSKVMITSVRSGKVNFPGQEIYHILSCLVRKVENFPIRHVTSTLVVKLHLRHLRSKDHAGMEPWLTCAAHRHHYQNTGEMLYNQKKVELPGQVKVK